MRISDWSSDVCSSYLAVAKSWESACRSLDVDRILSHLSEDATVWYNFDPETVHDRNAYRAILDNSAKGFRNQQYKDMRVHYHPGGFVEQATLQGDTDNGVIEDRKSTRLNSSH